MKIASVIVDNAARETDRAFEYIIPDCYEDFISIGMRVAVPFGKSNKYIEGYVIDIKDSSDFDIKRLKTILDVADNTVYFDKEMLDLINYMKNRYSCTLRDAMSVILPPGIKYKERFYVRKKDEKILNEAYKKLALSIPSDGYIEYNQLKDLDKSVSRSLLFKMESEGIIEIKRDIIQDVDIKSVDIYVPSDEISIRNFKEMYGNKRKRQLEVLENIIKNSDRLTLTELINKYGCSPAVIKGLSMEGALVRVKREVLRNPSNKDYVYGRVLLTDDQKNAVNSIIESYKKGIRISLIHGVTGSGKTEIYLNIVENFINKGYGAIVLVPEIALTPQTLERFKGRFSNRVAILHSRLSNGERYDEWRRIKSGQVNVVVGARSAVFAPVKNLKLIIMDEEHEYSYKSESNPKYFTKDIGEFRTKRNNGLLILGSATPSLESYYNALNGKYNLISITKRIKNSRLPEINVVDMRDELKNGNKSIFSRSLFEEIKSNLERKEQTILFLNRRGYSTFISCRECGYVCKCNNCDIPLTYHVNRNKLLCHYCGFEYEAPKLCPKCKSKYIKYFGTGTEKIETEIKKYFPEAKTLRMDMDTTRKKGEHERIYEDFKKHRADILIGTQMVSKGMDFKGVTLVGVIAADTTLNLPDFRAPERTFQLITQVAGRAGRGERPGRVVVQTYDPKHYSIEYSSRGDYLGFYEKEISYRKAVNNPPFTDILYVLLLSEKEERIVEFCEKIKEKLKPIINNNDINMLGPAPCQIGMIKKSFRWHIIFKGNVYYYINDISDIIYKSIEGDITYSIDVNPYNMT